MVIDREGKEHEQYCKTWDLLLPAVLNPATAAVLGIGLIAVGLYRLLPGDDEEPTVEAEAADDAAPNVLETPDASIS